MCYIYDTFFTINLKKKVCSNILTYFELGVTSSKVI